MFAKNYGYSTAVLVYIEDGCWCALLIFLSFCCGPHSTFASLHLCTHACYPARCTRV